MSEKKWTIKEWIKRGYIPPSSPQPQPPPPVKLLVWIWTKIYTLIYVDEIYALPLWTQHMRQFTGWVIIARTLDTPDDCRSVCYIREASLYIDKYNNWCKASKLIAPALTTIWSQIFKMGSWKKKKKKQQCIIAYCLLLVFYYFHNYYFNQ